MKEISEMDDKWISTKLRPKRLRKEIVREIIIMHHGEVTTGFYIIPYGIFASKYGQDITGEVKWWQALPEPKRDSYE